ARSGGGAAGRLPISLTQARGTAEEARKVNAGPFRCDRSQPQSDAPPRPLVGDGRQHSLPAAACHLARESTTVSGTPTARYRSRPVRRATPRSSLVSPASAISSNLSCVASAIFSNALATSPIAPASPLIA